MTTNLFRQLLDLLPEQPLLVGTVTVVNSDETVTVQLSGGGLLRVRGAAAVDDRVFVRNGVIEGPAPALTDVTIDI
ncbi:hypothetical protein [Hydrogenophaga sp.]|uniref:hypothetical protein n=1 Tax=Hydrogenophaga sp. TaxID=1904254 RepID=UPI002725A4A6|nr:hypothetical protein [Hydrogenophaga sp.]MDO8903958.1 hypothetical protein [Hydrogenophaga sp.]